MKLTAVDSMFGRGTRLKKNQLKVAEHSFAGGQRGSACFKLDKKDSGTQRRFLKIYSFKFVRFGRISTFIVF